MPYLSNFRFDGKSWGHTYHQSGILNFWSFDGELMKINTYSTKVVILLLFFISNHSHFHFFNALRNMQIRLITLVAHISYPRQICTSVARLHSPSMFVLWIIWFWEKMTQLQRSQITKANKCEQSVSDIHAYSLHNYLTTLHCLENT